VSTFQRLRRILAEVLRIDEREIAPDSSLAELFDHHAADSLDRAEFVLATEEGFGDLEIPDEEAAGWEDLTRAGIVQQLADLIDRRRRR
jgi:acyl carrier protein